MTDTTRRIRFIQTQSTGREVFLAGRTYDLNEAEAAVYLRPGVAEPAVDAAPPLPSGAGDPPAGAQPLSRGKRNGDGVRPK